MSSFQVGKTERFAGIVVKQLNVFSTRNGNNNELRALRSTGEVVVGGTRIGDDVTTHVSSRGMTSGYNSVMPKIWSIHSCARCRSVGVGGKI